MKKRLISMLEPRWIADEATSLGKLSDINKCAEELINASRINQIAAGDRKLSVYFENEEDGVVVRYYVARECAGDQYREKSLLLISEYGAVYRLHEFTTYPRQKSPLRNWSVRFAGMYFCDPTTAATRVSGGFLLGGDDYQSTGFEFPGKPGFNVRLCADPLNDCVEFDKVGGRDPQCLSASRSLGVVSYRCLARFYAETKTSDSGNDDPVLFPALIRLFRERQIVLVDAEKDESRHVDWATDAEYKNWKKHDNGDMTMVGAMTLDFIRAKSPAPGFVSTDIGKTGIRFHRSGNVLFEDSISKRQYVFGMDENSYFGCELSHECGTHDKAVDALLSLAPFEARLYPKRKASELKPYVWRQGEWFLVPHFNDPTLPTPQTHPDECLVLEQDAYLPRDSVDSSFHVLNPQWIDGGNSCYYVAGEPTSSCWVHLPTGVVYVRSGSLVHSNGDHDDLDFPVGPIPKELLRRQPTKPNRWNLTNSAWSFVRNLASRSFSEAGVD
jgi:hypothetical protein